MFFYVETIDNFILNNSFSPILTFSLGVLLIKCYPSVKQWSTARSDTTIIISSTFGLLSATTILNAMGFLERPIMPPIYSVIVPNLGLCCLRTLLGLFIVAVTRQIVKTVVLRSSCALYGLDWKNPETKRLARIEMPYYYLTYFAIGFNIGFTCPLVFRALGINRDYSYTEL
jgi:sphingosine-1-phosphate phosphatase 1